jgi:CheY-like chemotaxis protein
MVTTLNPAIAKKANQFHLHMAEDIGTMRADVTKVRQILFNLMSNSCKFTEQGKISLDVDRLASDGQDWIRFRVSDTGIGITAKQRENLFREFTQADSSISRKYGGTGLGLAISYRFVQMMKGWIDVESEPEKGSTFSVHLPANLVLDAAESTPAETSSSATEAPLSAKTEMDTVLVIDDDSSVRDLLSRSLTKQGFHVITAASGEEGLHLAKQVHPLVITLDVMMPDWDGWTVLNKIKADPELTAIPVIMVTIVDNETMGIDLGASNYLVKPVDRERLATLIENHRANRASGGAGASAASGNWQSKRRKNQSEVEEIVPARK